MKYIKYSAISLVIVIVISGVLFFRYQTKKNLYYQSMPNFYLLMESISQSCLFYGRVPHTNEFLSYVDKNDSLLERYLIDAKIYLKFDETKNFIFLYSYGYDNDNDHAKNVLYIDSVTFLNSLISDGDIMICGREYKLDYAANLREDLFFDFEGCKIKKTKADSIELRNSKNLLFIPYYNNVYNLDLKEINYFPPSTFLSTLEIRFNDKDTYEYKWHLGDKSLHYSKLNYNILERNISLLKKRKAKVLYLRFRIAEGKESFEAL